MTTCLLAHSCQRESCTGRAAPPSCTPCCAQQPGSSRVSLVSVEVRAQVAEAGNWHAVTMHCWSSGECDMCVDVWVCVLVCVYICVWVCAYGEHRLIHGTAACLLYVCCVQALSRDLSC